MLGERTADGTLEILAGLQEFREHLGGALNVTLPRGIGSKVEVHEMNPLFVQEAIEYLGSIAGDGDAA